uniref:F-box domain-containing protein n=1 Tax=Panagrellus redivivus TaxID=6233 RepID=A0A7E4VQX4_PANRE
MPYPILTLPYPFAQRLCQLLTPEELENLQTAAAHEIGQLKPIVQSMRSKLVIFYAINSKVVMNLVNHSIRTSVYKTSYLKCDVLGFHQLNESMFKKSNFSHLYFKAKKLGFWGCDISITFLKTVALMIPAIHQLNQLDLSFSQRIDEAIKLPFIFHYFPNLLCFKTSRAYKGWVNDLLDLNIGGLSFFYIKHTNFDELFSFKAEQLYNFIQKQQSKFMISINYKYSADANTTEIKRSIVTLLKPKFQIVKKGVGKIELNIASTPFNQEQLRFDYKT